MCGDGRVDVCRNQNKRGGKEGKDPCTTMTINTEQECTKYLTFFFFFFFFF